MSRPTVRIIESRSGTISAVADDIQIHSRYDPEQEAHRFVQARLQGKTPLTVIVIGAGLGYITAQLRNQCATCKLICLYLLPVLHSRAICRGDKEWHPDMPTSAAEFLRSALVEEDLVDLEVVVWSPLRRLFLRETEAIERQTRALLQELSANLTTTGSLGKLWLRNAMANFLFIDMPIRPPRIAAPIIIAAAGPRLELALDDIHAARDRAYIWALPSALAALLHRRIVPDLVVVTDPTIYTAEHLRPIAPIAGQVAEHAMPVAMPVAMPLTAARAAARLAAGAPTMIFNQGFGIEHDLALVADAPLVAANGTVAGSALELALGLGATAIVFAGLDLCSDDMKLYARPHAFDHYQWECESRLHPICSYRYDRIARGTRSAHSLFASWFRTRAARNSVPIMRLYPSSVDVGLPTAGDWLEHQRPLAPTLPDDQPDDQTHTRLRDKRPRHENLRNENLRNENLRNEHLRHERLRAIVGRWQNEFRAATLSQTLLQQRRLCEIAMSIDMPAYLRAVRDTRRGNSGAQRQLTEVLLAVLERSLHWIGRVEAR